VAQAKAFLVQRIQEFDPTVDVRSGPFNRLVLTLTAPLQAAFSSVIETQTNYSLSLAQITADPARATPSMVDNVISNFRVTRNPGAAATGQVTLVLDSLIPVVIPTGFIFSAPGNITFATTQSWSAKTDPTTVILPSDVPIRSVGNNQYAFTIVVTAQAIGISGNIPVGTALTMPSPLPHVLRAYAQSSFTGGVDADTNQDLINKLDTGMAAHDLSNRSTIEALLLAQPEFANFLDVSCVGYGDPEQQRYHSIFPVAFGGRTDIYVRSQALPAVTMVTKTATLVAVTSQGGTWQVSLARSDVPGFYEVQKIVITGTDPSSQSGYQITSLVQGLDTSPGTSPVPDVATPLEAAFSPYATAVIQFTDTTTPTTGLIIGTSTAKYDLYASAMPLLLDIQNFLGGTQVVDLAGDILVKGMVPCFTGITGNINNPSSQAPPDVTAIAAAVADFVNKGEFNGTLSASAILGVIHGFLSGGQVVSSLMLNGRIVRPDGNTTTLASPTALIVPNLPAALTTGNTVGFVLDPGAVSLTVTNI
jgi:hypothetical protein